MAKAYCIFISFHRLPKLEIMRKLILLSSLFSCCTICFAQSGELDPSFGNHGIVTTDMDSAVNYSNVGKQVLLESNGSIYIVSETAWATIVTKKHSDGSSDISYGNNGYSFSIAIYDAHAVLQPDGKILIAGYTSNSERHYNETNLAVARLNSNGSLDNTFGNNGIVVTDFGDPESADCIAVQPDGKILLTATVMPVMNSSYSVLLRYNENGSMDNTFTIQTISVGSGITIQSDGKIILNGSGLFRYNSDGTPDSSFNGDGHQAISGNAIAIQNDGKIVIGSNYSFNDSNYIFSVTRLNSNGHLDSTFGVNGIQTTDFGRIFDAATSISVQTNDKITLTWYMRNGNDKSIAFARYNLDGTPDNSFSDDGKQIAYFGSSNDYYNSIAIQSDGKFVALGYIGSTNDNIALARYDSDGIADNSFNGGAILNDHINQGSTFYTSAAVQSDGKILASGYSWNASNYEFALARYNIDGSLDNTFSGDGKQMTGFGSFGSRARAISIQGDGKILIAGSIGDNVGLVRYNYDGSLDNSFGNNGIQNSDFGLSDSATAIALQGDGKIVVAGTVIARYNTDGSLDMSFDGVGYLIPYYSINGVAIQNDGKIVVVSGFYNVVVDRYNLNGSVDSSFGDNGERFVSDYMNLTGTSIAIQNDGKIVIGGYYWFADRGVSSQFALLRLNADGSFDNSFNGSGIVFANINYNDYATSVIVQSDNKIIIAGYSWNGSSDDFTIFRYNTDGSLDNTFSSDGFVVTPASGAYDRIAGIAINNDKLYAVGYGQYPGNFGVVARYFLAEGGALPVSLLDFTGALQNKSVLLKWKIATEKNLTKFVIERSADGNRFFPINNETAAGASAYTRNYSTIDAQPLQGINFYRLKLVDADGKFTYSNIVAVKISSNNKLQIFPNPAQRILFVEANGNNENAIVQIVDGGGRKLKEVKVFLDGKTSFSVDISSLPGGVYNLILHKNDKAELQRFIKE